MVRDLSFDKEEEYFDESKGEIVYPPFKKLMQLDFNNNGVIIV
jgi:hypothetical protein